MLLALWLVQDGNGDQLITVSGWTQQTLVQRLAKAALPFLPRGDSTRRTKDGRAAWGLWLGQQLGLTNEPLPDTITDTTLAGWQQVLSRMHDLLAVVVERQHVPGSVHTVVESTLLARDADPPLPGWWVGVVSLLVLLVTIGWIFLRPAVTAPAAQTTARSRTVPRPVDAQTLAQDALAMWTTMPVSGTLHRRVWAVDQRPTAHDQVHVTDVWLASDTPQYRVETTRDGQLMEWQVVIAANSCISSRISCSTCANGRMAEAFLRRVGKSSRCRPPRCALFATSGCAVAHMAKATACSNVPAQPSTCARMACGTKEIVWW